MPWEYLDAPHLQGRVFLVAGYLATRCAGKVILDLNCRTAPVAVALPATWAEYVGNDTDRRFLALAKRAIPGGRFLLCADADLPRLERLDVLLCLGYACGFSDAESVTLDATVRNLVVVHAPGVVVLEAWLRIALGGGFLALGEFLRVQGYNLVHAYEVRPAGRLQDGMAVRQVQFWERG